MNISPEAIREPEIPQDDLDKYIPAEIGVAYFNKLFYLDYQYAACLFKYDFLDPAHLQVLSRRTDFSGSGNISCLCGNFTYINI